MQMFRRFWNAARRLFAWIRAMLGRAAALSKIARLTVSALRVVIV
jgi:hypothetical protein